MRAPRAVAFSLSVSALGLPSCESTLPPQGQVLLVLDTDAQLASPPLFDRVLVEIFAPSETTPCAGCSRELPVDVAKFREMAFSFGFVPTPRVVGHVARLRLFRSAGRGAPRPESTIELVGYLPAVAEDGVVTLTATFRTDDVGRPRGTLAAPILFERGAPRSSAEGTWAPGLPVACAGALPAGAVCVPGGAFFMGDPRVSVTDTTHGGAREHLVVLSPFYLDAREVTVGDIRASGLATIDSRGRALDPVDDSRGPIDGVCDYTASPGPWEELPVDCVSFQLASKFCRALGGDLPTEAQLERVASDQGRILAPWGAREPACDEAVVLRKLAREQGGCSTIPPLSLDRRVLPERAGSGSLDRVVLAGGTVVDLGGNLTEWTRDTFQTDNGPCWAGALLRDPVCAGDPAEHSTKGGDLVRVPVDFAQVRRAQSTKDATYSSPEIGFRCAYPSK